ncbi:MAG: tetratricopeptide repeat protein [Pseudomonadota bacterium]
MMTKAKSFGAAISLVAMASSLAACATPQVRGDLVKRTGDDMGLATRAAVALSNKDYPGAVSYAERAVAKTPDDAGFRSLLGNAYFAAGRFQSAEAAYKDALSLYSDQPQVVLKLILAEIALGKTNDALNYLDASRGALPAADFGLALALAGKPGEAVEVLQAAARERGADARLRQNLALAYALSGEWVEARTVAAQDVPADQLDARIQQWMQLAKPGKPSDQVASLVGVKPAADSGMPVQLALAKPDTRLAQAAAAPAPAAPVVVRPVVAEAAPPPPPAAELVLPPVPPVPQFAEAVAPAPPPPNPVRHAAAQRPAPKAVEAASPAPVTTALLTAAANVQTAFNNFISPKPRPVAAKPKKVAAQLHQAALRRGNSSAVVQLGAYGSPERVAAAWSTSARKYSLLKGYMPVSARFESSRGTVYRLSVKGFASADQAKDLCVALRRSGGSCFVRSVAGDAPVQYAAR